MNDTAAENGAEGAPPRFVFVHIPKTAGTTLTTVLRMNERGTRIRHLGNVFKGGGGTKRGATFDVLREANGQQLDGVRILTGHVPIGISEYFPENLDVRYFTFLRDPVDRTLSHYFQVREISQRRTGAKNEPLPPGATLEQALASDHIHDNLHTRMLSGQAEPFGEVDDAMLEDAKRNLRDKVVFFGLTERFDESLVLAKRRLGLRSILYRSGASSASRGRVNPSRPRGEDVPDELVEAAKACNRYDLELYAYARKLFASSPELGELEFEVEVAALRAAKAEGEIDLDVAAPAGFDGGETSWRMLLEARANAVRHEAELTEIHALSEEIARRDPKAAEQLGRLSRGKRRVGRDPSLTLRALQMLSSAPPKPASRTTPAKTPVRAPSPRTKAVSAGTPAKPKPAGGGAKPAPAGKSGAARSPAASSPAKTAAKSRRKSPAKTAAQRQRKRPSPASIPGGRSTAEGSDNGGSKSRRKPGSAKNATPDRGGQRQRKQRKPGSAKAKPQGAGGPQQRKTKRSAAAPAARAKPARDG